MSKTRRPNPVQLKQAHEVLSRERPVAGAEPEMWLTYYRRSAAVYAEVAEIDRGHHHEALYWASREERKAREIAEQHHESKPDRRGGRKSEQAGSEGGSSSDA